MDVFRLGLPFNSNYTPDKTISGYSSMVWTERFQDHGEFQLQTPNIKQAMVDLPKYTLISHKETTDVHMCENYELTEDQYGRPVLQISGKSLTSYLGHRWVEAPYQKKREMARDYSWTGAIAVLLWQAFCNPTGKDVTRDGDYSWNTRDVIPNTIITDSAASDGTSRRKWLTEGELWAQLQPMLVRSDKGVRVIRPTTGQFIAPVEVVDVDDMPVSDRGKITRTELWTPTSALRFDVYDGVDRSADQDVNPKVVFSRLRGDIGNAKFIESIADYKTALEVMSAVSVPDHYRTGQSTLEGLARRVFGYDAGSPELPPEPQKPKDLKSNATSAQKTAYHNAMDKWIDDHDDWEVKVANKRDKFLDDIEDDLQAELKAHKEVSVFDGDVLPTAPYRYRWHYNLGDKVTLYGDNDSVETKVVTEYIRSEDDKGDLGYPTFTSPDVA